PADSLAKMVGRQLPFFALLLPFYVIAVYAGFRNMLRIWPVLLVSGARLRTATAAGCVERKRCLRVDASVDARIHARAGSSFARIGSRVRRQRG
ncbi:L-lactate permease, partial [Mesorhizobium sp. M00.F.Ca.ET.216.01.1.1]|uniref:L-lactate permease n=1 Tax=Mesorhizobium sp. M00.F.Ca.ET.216.01.1.1 TaxID=2500528 RepID=UPI001AEE5123